MLKMTYHPKGIMYSILCMTPVIGVGSTSSSIVLNPTTSKEGKTQKVLSFENSVLNSPFCDQVGDKKLSSWWSDHTD